MQCLSQDTTAERDFLTVHVWPELDGLARQLGLRRAILSFFL